MNSVFSPAVPAGAFDEFAGEAGRASRAQPAWTPAVTTIGGRVMGLSKRSFQVT